MLGDVDNATVILELVMGQTKHAFAVLAGKREKIKLMTALLGTMLRLVDHFHDLKRSKNKNLTFLLETNALGNHRNNKDTNKNMGRNHNTRSKSDNGAEPP